MHQAYEMLGNIGFVHTQETGRNRLLVKASTKPNASDRLLSPLAADGVMYVPDIAKCKNFSVRGRTWTDASTAATESWAADVSSHASSEHDAKRGTSASLENQAHHV